jgi:hypothetical protein
MLRLVEKKISLACGFALFEAYNYSDLNEAQQLNVQETDQAIKIRELI